MADISTLRGQLLHRPTVESNWCAPIQARNSTRRNRGRTCRESDEAHGHNMLKRAAPHTLTHNHSEQRPVLRRAAAGCPRQRGARPRLRSQGWGAGSKQRSAERAGAAGILRIKHQRALLALDESRGPGGGQRSGGAAEPAPKQDKPPSRHQADTRPRRPRVGGFRDWAFGKSSAKHLHTCHSTQEWVLSHRKQAGDFSSTADTVWDAHAKREQG